MGRVSLAGGEYIIDRFDRIVLERNVSLPTNYSVKGREDWFGRKESELIPRL